MSSNPQGGLDLRGSGKARRVDVDSDGPFMTVATKPRAGRLDQVNRKQDRPAGIHQTRNPCLQKRAGPSRTIAQIGLPSSDFDSTRA